MKQIKIRTKIMLLYTALSLLVLLILIPVVYTAFSGAQRRALAADLQLAGSEIFSCIEEQNGTFSADTEELDFEDARHTFCILQADTVLLAGKNGQWLSGLHADHTAVQHDGADWLVQTQAYELSETKFQIITAGRMDGIVSANRRLILLLVLLIPFYVGLTAAGSYLLAKRALQPVRSITQTALQIESGGLCRRITGIETRDEVGELAGAFNAMLDRLETSFRRERQFTSDASHELRTPLAIISACAEKRSGELPPELEENLAEIRTECAGMTKLISQLLMLSRGYEGRIHLTPEELCLFDIADSVCDLVSRSADAANITICNQISPDLQITADQSLLTQLFMNLIGNAVKYGKPGGHVWLDAEQKPEGVQIRISDDGLGISEEDQAHIFERFYRADRSRDRTGTGLGLSIVQWIAELHGGSVSVRSALGHGSCFTVILPI